MNALPRVWTHLMYEGVEEALCDGLHVPATSLHLRVKVLDPHHLTDGPDGAVTHEAMT